MDTSALKQLAALLLLMSPFFFWGTSTVAMKVWPHISLKKAQDTCTAQQTISLRAHLLVKGQGHAVEQLITCILQFCACAFLSLS